MSFSLSLLREIEAITDRELRHKARSLFACYLGYLELRPHRPSHEKRAAALRDALRELGVTIGMQPAEFPATRTPTN